MTYRQSRRAVLAGAAAAALPLAGCAADGDDGQAASGPSPSPTDDGGRALAATPVATDIGSPTDVVPLPGGDLLVAEQRGRIVRVADDETAPLLDLRGRIVEVSGYSERGLLGVEPHPEFASNGRLFVRYSAPPRSGTPSGYSHTFVLAEFAVDPADLTADPDSERAVLEIPEPQPNHNAGPLAFGPDGRLYVPVGDGGGANDQGEGHVEDWYDPVPGGNGQDTTENLLGSLLRIDVDGESGDRAYAVPEDNPLVGSEGLDEHYAWGLRNPWGISFGPDGRLFVADVGQDSYEEINVVERGGNYGWNVREGTACFQASDCPTVTPDGERLRDPIVAYPQEGGEISGQAVVGGYLYDGDDLPALQGRYVFGDWQWGERLFVAREREGGDWEASAVPVDADDVGSQLLTIGRDAGGELLLGTSDGGADSDSGGAIHRITQP